jgi:hypothetical protein
MGVTQTKLDAIKAAALAEFDEETHIGFGTSNQVESPLDTDLIVPIIRKAFDVAAVKSVSAGTYDFSATLGLTEGNGSTYQETGVFDAASSGEMGTRKLMSVSVSKTSSIELSIGLRIEVTVTGV